VVRDGSSLGWDEPDVGRDEPDVVRDGSSLGRDEPDVGRDDSSLRPDDVDAQHLLGLLVGDHLDEALGLGERHRLAQRGEGAVAATYAISGVIYLVVFRFAPWTRVPASRRPEVDIGVGPPSR
jgi:hypothetical protein